jgi:hypothetical protein
MKTFFSSFIVAMLSLIGLGCEKDNDLGAGPCAKGKLIQQWCSAATDLGVVQILSESSIGEEWTKNGKTYQNVLLAQIDEKLLKDFNELSTSSDSTFYFSYTIKENQDVLMCYVCCAPSKTIFINAISQFPCTIITH